MDYVKLNRYGLFCVDMTTRRDERNRIKLNQVGITCEASHIDGAARIFRDKIACDANKSLVKSKIGKMIDTSRVEISEKVKISQCIYYLYAYIKDYDYMREYYIIQMDA